jgi:hypothetical protein
MSFLTPDLRSKGMSLGQHIHEIAFPLADARQILESLDGTGVVILGGDFCRRAATGAFVPHMKIGMSSVPPMSQENNLRDDP